MTIQVGHCDGCGLWSSSLKEGYCVECVRKQKDATNNS